MSNNVRKLSRAHTNIVLVLESIDLADGRSYAKVDRACKNLEDWIADNPPPKLGERGGTSTRREEDEREDEGRLRRQVNHDIARARALVKSIERDADELYLLVVRNFETIDPSKLPPPAPQCVSCARPQNPKNPRDKGYFSEVAEPAPTAHKWWGRQMAVSVARFALCSFCRANAVANAKEAGDDEVATRHFPALKACEILNDKGPVAAGRWIQAQKPAARRSA